MNDFKRIKEANKVKRDIFKMHEGFLKNIELLTKKERAHYIKYMALVIDSPLHAPDDEPTEP